MAAKKRAPREAPPPGKYIRGKMGTYAKIRGAGRDDQGRKLYRLAYLSAGDAEPVVGTREWTLEELTQAVDKFMEKRPSDAALRRQDERMKLWFQGHAR